LILVREEESECAKAQRMASVGEETEKPTAVHPCEPQCDSSSPFDIVRPSRLIAMQRILTVGLDLPEVQELRSRTEHPISAYEMVPKIRLENGQLLVVDPTNTREELSISQVIFHGIFENDLPILAALALWGGPCLPSAHGMLDCRPRISNLARTLRVTKFGRLPRGYGDHGRVYRADEPTVAKWGEWHCGENKERFVGEWVCREPTLFERFIEGEAVRIQLIGDQAWQVHLAGTDWKKSIHGPGASLVEPDRELVEDTRRLQQHFALPVIAVDYMISTHGEKFLLEVNHIPNITEFAAMRESYLNFATEWLKSEVGQSVQ
jgi:hypothetical protein